LMIKFLILLKIILISPFWKYVILE
jgi:hypothetical protein